jgi:hypothetical protein
LPACDRAYKLPAAFLGPNFEPIGIAFNNPASLANKVVGTVGVDCRDLTVKYFPTASPLSHETVSVEVRWLEGAGGLRRVP